MISSELEENSSAAERKLLEMEDCGPREFYQPIGALRRKVIAYCDKSKMTIDSFREKCACTSKKSWNKFMTYPYKNSDACKMNESYTGVISFFAYEEFNKKVEPLRSVLSRSAL